MIAGGHSNLTFLVTDANGRRLVLRRPPLAHGLASAHDMAREHRIISALHRSAVPVPMTLGLCEDSDINGAPFYVMDYIAGHVLRDVVSAEQLLNEQSRARASESLADTLAAIHQVDLDAVGLSDLGRPEDYLARQLRRWYGQWEQQRTRDLDLIDNVHHELVANLPEQGPATIVHGDYRLDNMLFDRSGDTSVVTVLDWQTAAFSRGPNDIAYGIGSGLLLNDRRSHESALVERYWSGLDAAGVTCSFDDVRHDYRIGTVTGFVMAVIASQVVTATERGDEMFAVMAERHAQQMIDNDVFTLAGGGSE